MFAGKLVGIFCEKGTLTYPKQLQKMCNVTAKCGSDFFSNANECAKPFNDQFHDDWTSAKLYRYIFRLYLPEDWVFDHIWQCNNGNTTTTTTTTTTNNNNNNNSNSTNNSNNCLNTEIWLSTQSIIKDNRIKNL